MNQDFINQKRQRDFDQSFDWKQYQKPSPQGFFIYNGYEYWYSYEAFKRSLEYFKKVQKTISDNQTIEKILNLQPQNILQDALFFKQIQRLLNLRNNEIHAKVKYLLQLQRIQQIQQKPVQSGLSQQVNQQIMKKSMFNQVIKSIQQEIVYVFENQFNIFTMLRIMQYIQKYTNISLNAIILIAVLPYIILKSRRGFEKKYEVEQQQGVKYFFIKKIQNKKLVKIKIGHNQTEWFSVLKFPRYLKDKTGFDSFEWEEINQQDQLRKHKQIIQQIQRIGLQSKFIQKKQNTNVEIRNMLLKDKKMIDSESYMDDLRQIKKICQQKYPRQQYHIDLLINSFAQAFVQIRDEEWKIPPEYQNAFLTIQMSALSDLQYAVSYTHDEVVSRAPEAPVPSWVQQNIAYISRAKASFYQQISQLKVQVQSIINSRNIVRMAKGTADFLSNQIDQQITSVKKQFIEKSLILKGAIEDVQQNVKEQIQSSQRQIIKAVLDELKNQNSGFFRQKVQHIIGLLSRKNPIPNQIGDFNGQNINSSEQFNKLKKQYQTMATLYNQQKQRNIALKRQNQVNKNLKSQYNKITTQNDKLKQQIYTLNEQLTPFKGKTINDIVQEEQKRRNSIMVKSRTIRILMRLYFYIFNIQMKNVTKIIHQFIQNFNPQQRKIISKNIIEQYKQRFEPEKIKSILNLLADGDKKLLENMTFHYNSLTTNIIYPEKVLQQNANMWANYKQGVNHNFFFNQTPDTFYKKK